MLSSTGCGISGARGKLLKESVWELSLRPVGVSKRDRLLGPVKLTSDCADGTLRCVGKKLDCCSTAGANCVGLWGGVSLSC